MVRQSINARKVVAQEVASHVNPKGPPMNATAMMAVVPKLRRSAAFFNGFCNDEALNSVERVMLLGVMRSQKVGIKNRSGLVSVPGSQRTCHLMY